MVMVTRSPPSSWPCPACCNNTELLLVGSIILHNGQKDQARLLATSDKNEQSLINGVPLAEYGSRDTFSAGVTVCSYSALYGDVNKLPVTAYQVACEVRVVELQHSRPPGSTGSLLRGLLTANKVGLSPTSRQQLIGHTSGLLAL
jgi:hypothetical protein